MHEGFESRTEIGPWLGIWREMGVGDSSELRRLHSDVRGRYSEPHRHYHTDQHLVECFEKIQDIISLAEHPAEVSVGLWFHDAIYDTQRHDNEERSAEWARSAAQELGASAESARRIYDLIMCARHTAEPVGIDAQVLVDADLSILGARPARFQEYEAQVRSEYSWVPDAMFRTTRAKILKELLGRSHLYSTAHFRERYEAQARRNLQHSLGHLEGRDAAGVYVRKGYRKRGVTSALIATALKAAKRRKAPALEAYPLDADLTPSASGTGYASTFLRAGFKMMARHVPPRPIMRHDLRGDDLGG